MYKKVAASLITAFQLVLKKINGYVNSVLGIVTQLKYLFNKPDKLVRARKTIFCLFWNTFKKMKIARTNCMRLLQNLSTLIRAVTYERWQIFDQHVRIYNIHVLQGEKENITSRSEVTREWSRLVTLDSNLPSKMFARIVVIFIQEREISHVLFQTTLTITRVYELPSVINSKFSTRWTGRL